jgi:hypothetical protein
MKGALPWSVRYARRAGTIDFCPTLAALVSQVRIQILFPCRTLFHFISPHRPATWASSLAGSPVSVSLVQILEGSSKDPNQCLQF